MMGQYYVVGRVHGDIITCTSIAGQPAIFNSYDEALAEIRDHKQSMKEAGLSDDLKWEPLSVTDITNTQLRWECGLD